MELAQDDPHQTPWSLSRVISAWPELRDIADQRSTQMPDVDKPSGTGDAFSLVNVGGSWNA